jgi:hypothetical protein
VLTVILFLLLFLVEVASATSTVSELTGFGFLLLSLGEVATAAASISLAELAVTTLVLELTGVGFLLLFSNAHLQFGPLLAPPLPPLPLIHLTLPSQIFSPETPFA